MMSVSPKGVDLVKRFEGFSAKPYLCPAGVNTIGYGHTIQQGELFDTITEEEGEELLKADLHDAEDAIDTYVKVDLNQNQFDALASLIYNIGAGNFRSSTMLRLLNQGNYNAAAKQFERWVHSRGRKLPGLITRRMAERELFEGVA